MIHSRIASKAQTTIPKAVREALARRAGDELSYEVEGDRVVLRRRDAADPFDNPVLAFTEWAGEADCRACDGFEPGTIARVPLP